jgi:hypothetical protein
MTALNSALGNVSEPIQGNQQEMVSASNPLTR